MLHALNQRHDDHGGLHRDLTATGSAMGRRELLRRFNGANVLNQTDVVRSVTVAV
jgi:hypothetical protein